MDDRSLYSRLLVGRAESFAALERYAEAMRDVHAALRWDLEREGTRSANVANDLAVAGEVSEFAGDLPRSRAYFSKALATRLEVSGRLHPEVLQDLNNLGSVAYLQGDSAGAEAFWRQALGTGEHVLGPVHPDVGGLLNNLARVLLEERKFADAEKLLTRSANIYLAQRSDTHDDLAFVFSNLALAKKGLGSSIEAEDLLRRALKAAEVHHNRLVAPIMVDLADLQCRRGDHADALDELERAAPIMKAQYPSDPWRTAWVENTRGACLLRQGDASGRDLVKATAPVLLKRWKPESLYGYEVEQRLRLAS